MKLKLASPWSPLVLCVLSNAAHADLEPFSFVASEQVSHHSNVFRTDGASAQADWLSTTELRAAFDEEIGREHLSASAAVNLNKYKKLSNSDSVGYSLASSLAWSTIGDLAGSFGADSNRRQYLYGLSGELPTSTRNIETTNHAFARFQLGGPARWQLFTGFDASQRKYSSPAFQNNEERQWSVNGGTKYQTSPDLSFGLTGSYSHGTYPNFLILGSPDEFSLKSLDATTRWQASGNSLLNARVGYTTENNGAQPARNFVNGGLDWAWTPPSHFSASLGLSRDVNSDTAAAPIVDSNGTANLAGRSVNNSAHISVTYELTAKVNFLAAAQYTRRRYSNSVLPDPQSGQTVSANGSNRTTSLRLSAHYAPTRTTDVSCGVSHEVRTVDSQVAAITPGYKDNGVMCSAEIQFR